MEEIKGLTQKQLYGMIKLQNHYYKMMEMEQQKRAKDGADELKRLGIVGLIILLFVWMVYFSMQDPPMYIEASDGTLSINPLYLERVKEEKEKALLAEYDNPVYYSEEEQE